MYAQEAFVRYQADAVTVNPYLGTDGLKPFLDWQDKGVVILCRTSNASAGELQDLSIEGSKVYLQVAELASRKWNYNGNVMLVVGATYPQELKEIRAAVGDIPFLVPGVGAQGGDTQEAVRSGIRSDGTGLAINASRAIIYAGSGQDFNEKAREAAQNLQKEINAARATIMAKGN
jgi:orotidine-5'-phosphate decarboxylase